MTRARLIELLSGLGAVALGGFIYVAWRPSSFLMFDWFNALGLDGEISAIRELAVPLLPFVDNWVLYSLPQSLWFFGGLMALSTFWHSDARIEKAIWISFFWLLAISLEVSQRVSLLAGAYDHTEVSPESLK